MDREGLTFGEELVLAEEKQRLQEERGGPPGLDREVMVIERSGFTTNSSFHINDGAREFPIDGPGVLDALVVVADNDQFDAYVEADGQEIVAGSLTSLQDDTVELERVSAYSRADDNNFLFAVHDYPFQKSIDAVITPTQSTTFDLQRAEIDLVR